MDLAASDRLDPATRERIRGQRASLLEQIDLPEVAESLPEALPPQ